MPTEPLTNTGGVSTEQQAWSGLKIFKDGLSAFGKKLVSLADPTSAQDAATKAYVDAQSGGGGDTFIRKYKAANGTPINDSTVLVADDDLKFDIAANEIWQFSSQLWFSSSVAIDFAVTGPAAPIFVLIGDAVGDYLPFGFSSTQTFTAGYGARGILFSGIIKNGVNAGTVNFEFAQDVADPSDTKALAGSYLIAHKIG